MKLGDIVRDKTSRTLFEVVALPSSDMPLLTVRFKNAPDQIRRVDPHQYEVVEAPQKSKRQARGGHDRMHRGGLDRAR